jgi:predicted SprT family Zn-dependent metalloprotease
MPKKEAPLQTLQDFLPPGAYPAVIHYLQLYKVHLTITRERRSILGDYRHAIGSKNHRISVNGTLNPFAFLITLIHELAHLVTFIKYGNQVNAHGKEWKQLYAELMSKFLHADFFPADIEKALERSLHNLPASSCADERLMRVLRHYDAKKDGRCLVEQLPEGKLFTIEGGKLFRKGKQLRKRFQCEEVETGKLYLFSPIYEVKPVETK